MFACFPTEIAPRNAINDYSCFGVEKCSINFYIVCCEFSVFQTVFCLRGSTFFIQMIRGLPVTGRAMWVGWNL